VADHEAKSVLVEDIWFKSQRVLRTIVQVGIPAFLAFALVLPQIIDAAGLPVDGALYAWLIGAAGVITAVAAGISRIMAIPAVNLWLTKIGLGSVPKAAAQKAATAPNMDEISPPQITDGSDQAPAGTSPTPVPEDK
jgi:hypothetical protein